ncbi:MAG: SusC/RagA family TonB-linked outer membrane protein [Acidobacterium ailaaui]|nr:SusC/RagA family TonB-linked outer membrane protein [Pseudacidobacterium ailaaui]
MKKIIQHLFLLSVCCFTINLVYAQKQIITGRVRTSNGSPVIGATIKIKGTNTGTLTDNYGGFSLLSSPGDTLMISYVGMGTKEVVVGTEPLNITLDFSNAILNEVVVLGYETTTRKSVTSSIAHVDATDIAHYTTGNVANALKGKVPGLQVYSGGGLPGAQPRIIINGLSSINNNNNPLIIMDGIEVGYNSLNFLNPSDVASIDVLKDASAAAIYGARSGQGVILITTKKGKGKPVIHLTATNGLNYLPNIKVANASEYARVMNEVAQNSGAQLPFPNPSLIQGQDYWKMAFDAGYIQNYVISASGGEKGLSFYSSLGYYRDDSYNATNKGGHWQKITGQFNGSMELGKTFEIGLTLSPRYESWLNSPNTTYSAYAMDPTVAPYKTVDSVYKSIPAGFMDMTAFNPYYSQPNTSSFNGMTNPIFYYITNFGEGEAFGLLYGTYLQVEPVSNLVLKTNVSGFVNADQSNNYSPKYYLASNRNNKEVSLTSSTDVNTRWQITNTAHYTFHIHEHHIDLLAGQSADKYTYKGTSASRKDIPLDEQSFRYISAAATVTGGSGSYQPGAAGGNRWGIMTSYFGSVRYNYKEKYYLSGSFRADGSSLINPKYRWGYFPTVSGAWVISEESFFSKLSHTISFLKLRASWGESGGNLPGSTGAYLTVLSPGNYPTGVGDDYITGYYPSNIANPEIKWEIQKDYTFGLDAAFLTNKIHLTAEKYTRNPSNLLEDVTVDYTLGYPQGYYPTQQANVGRMTTNGWDITLSYKDKFTSKLHFQADLTINHWKSIVKDLGGMDPILGHEANDVISTYRSRLTKGHQPGAWYGYIVEGVFQSDQEAANYVNKQGQPIQPLARAGDLKYKDINGDGVINSVDLTDIGSPWPKFTGGLTLQLNYGNFDFRTEFSGSWGAKYFQSYLLNMNPTGHLNFKSGLADKFWHGEGTSNTFPILRYPDKNGNFSNMSTFFLAEANFIKCNLMQLGFTIPQQWIKRIIYMRIYVSTQNLFTLTHYPGLNPDLPWYNSVGYNGVDNFQAILPRTFLIGIDASF